MSKLGRFSRTELLLGEAGMEKLANSTVAIFGVGGVGSFVAEGLEPVSAISCSSTMTSSA